MVSSRCIPSLTRLHERYRAQELIVFHAVASPYRERSHFDGQDLLENGTSGQPKGRMTAGSIGCCQRCAVRQERATETIAIALAQNLPLVLRGDARVNSWAPSRLPEADSDTLQRVADLYANDPWFATRLQTALAADDVADAGMRESGRRNPLNAIDVVSGAAGKFLAAADGPRIAVIEGGGWDTHANQGAERGQLANRLHSLDQGLESLRLALGEAWRRSAILVVTEFGRTVAVNGTRGTDHGTAGCAFLLGGAVAGGRVDHRLAGTCDARAVSGARLAADAGSALRLQRRARLSSRRRRERARRARLPRQPLERSPLDGLMRLKHQDK